MQGPDIGSQYRSIILYHDDKQKEVALQAKKSKEKKGLFSKKIATQIKPLENFYKAEEYHQHYIDKNKKAVC